MQQASDMFKNGILSKLDLPKFKYVVEASDDYFSLNATEYLNKNGCLTF